MAFRIRSRIDPRRLDVRAVRTVAEDREHPELADALDASEAAILVQVADAAFPGCRIGCDRRRDSRLALRRRIRSLRAQCATEGQQTGNRREANGGRRH